MIKEVRVTLDTKWECVGCGKCCHKIGDEFCLKLFGEKTVDGKCVKLVNKRCKVYSERPLGCRMYPFYPSWKKLKAGMIDFKIGSLKIDANCDGFGNGSKICRNKRLLRKLDKVALKLKEKIISNPKGKIKDLFM